MADRKLRCIVVDDEPLALDLLVKMLNKVSFIEIKHACSSASKAAAILGDEKIDLAFLDIQMPGITGLELAKQLHSETMVIFTTAFEEFALEGFNVAAVDYILKPIDADRLLVACQKAQNLFNWKAGDLNTDDIYIHANHKVIKIQVNEIIYIEGMKDYVKLFLVDQEKPLLTRMNLKTIQAMLPETNFRRVHKSYIVNWNRVSEWDKEKIMLGKISIPIGASFKDQLKPR